jgi:hypothetical protein
VFQLNFLNNGTGQTPETIYHLTSASASSGGTAVYNGNFPSCTGLVGSLLIVQNFTNTVFGGPTNGVYQVTACTPGSSGSVTLNNPHSVAEFNSNAVAITVYPITCTNNNTGTGFEGAAQVGPDGKAGNLFPYTPGYGYTAAPTGCSAQGTGGTAATVSASLDTTLQSLPIAGVTLTPSNTCITIDYITASQAPNYDTNIPSVVRCVQQSGTISPGIGANVGGFEEPEYVQITSVTGPDVNHIYTLNIMSHDPHSAPSLLIQNSATTPSVMWFDANATTYDNRPTGYGFLGAADSADALVEFWVRGGNSRLPLAGAEPEQTFAPNNTWHGYQGCKILYTTPTSRGTVPVLNYCNWTPVVNDAITIVPNPSVTIKMLGQTAEIGTPSNGTLSQAWQGAISGVSASINFLPINFTNGNRYDWYQGCGAGGDPQNHCYPASPGGALVAPNFINPQGPFQTIINTRQPINSMINVDDDEPGSNDYYLLTHNVSNLTGNILIGNSINQILFTGQVGIGGLAILPNTEFPNTFGSGINVFVNAGSFDGTNTALVLESAKFSRDSIPGLSAGSYTGGNLYIGAKTPQVGIIGVVGTPGSTAWCYVATSVTSSGHESVATGQFCTNTGNATLSGTNYVTVRFNPSIGAQSMNYYRWTASGGTGPEGLLCNVTIVSNSCNDQGTLVNPGQLPPTVDNSGVAYIGGLITSSSLAASTLPICPNGAGGALTTSGCAGGGSFPSGTTNQMLYYATSGTSVAVLTLGTNLSITGGVLNASSTGATAWSAITSGTNANTLLIGSGGSLGVSGTGTIAATSVPASGITGTALPSGVVSSSLTSLGTITTGLWHGTLIAPGFGGTGIANTASLTLGTANQNWATLGTGIVKNTTTTGALSLAAASDIYGLWSGTCSSTTFLRGDGSCATPSGAGTVTTSGSPTNGFLSLFTGSTVIGNSHIDDGVTTASVITSTERFAVADGSGIGGGSNDTEGTAPTGGTGVDNIWADSTDHRYKMINNNGTATDIVGFNDFGSASQFGVVKCDGTTITCSGGVISAVGGGGGFCSGLTCTVPSSGGTNGTITWGANFGASAATLYDGGSANRFGWGLAAGDMQFWVSSSSKFTWRRGGDYNSTPIAMQLDGNGLELSSLSSSTSPICPNGTGGALTTSGCTGGGSGALVNITSAITPTNCTVSSGQCVMGSNAASVTLASIPGTYISLRLTATCNTTDSSGTSIAAQFNGDTGNNYVWQQLFGSNTSAGTAPSGLIGHTDFGPVPGTPSGSTPGIFEVVIPNYSGTTFNKQTSGNGTRWNSSTQVNVQNYSGMWLSTAAINSIKMFSEGGGNLIAGCTFSLYGMQ